MTNSKEKYLYKQGMNWCYVLLKDAKASGDLDTILEQTEELRVLTHALQKLEATEAGGEINASNT